MPASADKTPKMAMNDVMRRATQPYPAVPDQSNTVRFRRDALHKQIVRNPPILAAPERMTGNQAFAVILANR